MKYIVLLVTIFTMIGCDMNRSNIMHLDFSKAEDFRYDDNLHINFIFYSNNSASNWYSYQKRITIMYNGELLINEINENNVLHTTLKVSNPNRSLYYEDSSNNVYGNIGVDIDKSYHLHPNYYNLSLEIKANPKKYSSKSIEYINVKKNPTLEYYNPTIAKYQVYPLDDETIEYISNTYTFEQLLDGDKLLEADIRKLEHLSREQIELLVNTHNDKKFRDIAY